MKDCVFCNIIRNGDNNKEEKNIILYEDNLILITQATGSPVRGYLMIVPIVYFLGLKQTRYMKILLVNLVK